MPQKITHTRKCAYGPCERQVGHHGALNLCPAHYNQLKRGEELRAIEPRNTMLPWLLAHRDYQGEGCLKWPFKPKANGYGQLKIDGKMRVASRVMCELAHGEPPTPDHQAAHSCGKGHEGCVNPKHLRWATTTENKADMIGHGTRRRGETIPWAKLNTATVRAVRAAVGTGSHREIGERFGITPNHVEKIVNRRIWSHV